MSKQDKVIEFPSTKKPNFKMIDLGRKRTTKRRAVASGVISMSPEAFKHIKNGTLPKGNVLALAESAGILGAKKTPEMIPMCHSLNLDQVTIHCELNDVDKCVIIYLSLIHI